jgi:hypothetical protein
VLLEYPILSLHPEFLVSHFWRRSDALSPERVAFTAANWQEAIGSRFVLPWDEARLERPIPRGLALSLVNKWNRSAQSQSPVRFTYWIDEA